MDRTTPCAHRCLHTHVWTVHVFRQADNKFVQKWMISGMHEGCIMSWHEQWQGQGQCMPSATSEVHTRASIWCSYQNATEA